jgi:hypothetical protein
MLKHAPSTHSEALTEAAKKHYEPLQWNSFFDELTFTSDVILQL